MKKSFICSLICHNGIIGGGLHIENKFIIFKTNKLTVDKKYRNLMLSINEIRDLTWKWVVFPIATFHMQTGEKYKVMIFNKKRFKKHYAEAEKN